MNKKSLLNFAMCSLLLGSLPVALVGCKDYDDDITEINGQTSDLSKQLESLNTALQAAQNAATAAANDAKTAADKADTATAEAALAKKAAEDAKAEALQAAIAEVEKLQGSINDANNLSTENAKEIAALAGRIDGIENGLANIDLTNVENSIGELSNAIKETNTQVEAIKVQIAALENLKSEISSLQGAVSDLQTKVAAIDTLKADLAKVQEQATKNAAAIKANATSITEIQGDIKTIKADLTKISAEISTQVSNGVNTVAGILSQRLTSVTLMPELYVGGIPTIEFESAQYTKKELKNGAWVNTTSKFVVSNNTTEAKYRLNPATLKNEDIDIKGMDYVTSIAETRATGVQSKSVVTVADANIGNDGVLTVKLGKNNTASLNLSGNQIYTASLKVPVAAKHLFDGEASANVYSEFTRLSETYFQPELRFVEKQYKASADNNGHLWNDSTVLYNSAENQLIAKNLVYNKTYDLYDLVEGCKLFSDPVSHKNVSIADLREYGLDINFAVATKAYTPSSVDKTNQQAFAQVSKEGILTPVAASGAAGNENIIGKEPIIRATLFDSKNHNIVEVGYFKVRYTAVDLEPVTFNLNVESTGDACKGASYNFTWDYMAKNVLEKLNLKGSTGTSKEDFTKIYNSYSIPASTTDNTVLAVNPGWSLGDVATPIMDWTATEIDLGLLKVGANQNVYKRTVTFSNTSGLYPDVVLNLTWTVNTTVGAVNLGTTNPIKWSGNTMKVTVVPMAIPYDGSQRAVYNTNILEGRNKPYVTGLTSCANYDVEYAATAQQPQAYVGEELTGFTHWALNSVNQANLNAINYVIKPTAAGKALVNGNANGTNKVVKVNWMSDVNGLAKNRFTFGTIDLEIVKILSLQATNANSITDNSQAVTTNLVDGLRITDAYGNLVAKNVTANHANDYWKFYGIQNPVFDAAGIKIATSADGANAASLASLNMTAIIDTTSGELTFQNNGSAIANDAYLIVPVKVAHDWGTLEGTVTVLLKKKL